MKTLVTGANSLVGAHIVRALIAEGREVRAFVRASSDLRGLDGLDIEKAVGDVLDVDSLIEAARGCSMMFHAAAVFSYRGGRARELLSVAEQGTINAVEAAKKAKIKRIVLTSSSVVLGSSPRPEVLDELKGIPESDPGVYAASKIRQEAAGFRRAAELGVDMTAVRPTLCVGPHDYRLTESNAVIINYLSDPLRATWPGGCNIVSARDAARAHLIVARKGKSGESYVAGSQNLRWREVHRMISELCGLQGPLITASHTSSFLAAVAQEISCRFTGKRPLVTRAQAKMVGRFYYYGHERLAALGYDPIPSRQALAQAISWLAASEHVPASLRNTLTLSEEVYRER